MKIRSIICILLAVVMVFALAGCGSKNEVEENTGEPVSNEQDNTKDSEQEDKDTQENDETDEDKDSEEDVKKEEGDKDSEEEESAEEVKEGIPSPLSGIYAPEAKVNRRPVAVMYDNHPKARWQAGLGQAEVVYEFRVEFPYTRYMAIFLTNDPKRIGPIRSSRPYFVTTLLEYDPVYVRVGGSEAAKAYIKELKLADIDGLYSGSFWRYYKTGKKAPNNMYSTMDMIRGEQKSRGYRMTGNYEGNKFNEKDTDLEGKNAEEVLIKYNEHNSTKYEYDKEQKVYKRHKDGKLHIDELDNSTITAKNIIIQKIATKSIDNVGRLEIEVVGSGEGYYITNGKAIEITWKRDSEKSKTRYYNENGEEIKFNAGNMWIQATLLNTEVTFK